MELGLYVIEVSEAAENIPLDTVYKPGTSHFTPISYYTRERLGTLHRISLISTLALTIKPGVGRKKHVGNPLQGVARSFAGELFEILFIFPQTLEKQVP